jgi:hypothetical protein
MPTNPKNTTKANEAMVRRRFRELDKKKLHREVVWVIFSQF